MSPPPRTTAPSIKLSITDMSPNRFRSCETCEIPSANTTCGGAPPIERPLTRMLPAEGRRKPLIVFSSDVLPAPLAPSSATLSPCRTDKVMPLNALTLPYCTSSPSISSIGLFASKIRLQHHRIVAHLLWRAFRQLLAVVQHHDLVRDRHHQVDHMLHQHDTDAGRRQPAQHPRQLHPFLRREPDRRLVQHQQARLACHRTCDLHQPLLPGR